MDCFQTAQVVPGKLQIYIKAYRLRPGNLEFGCTEAMQYQSYEWRSTRIGLHAQTWNYSRLNVVGIDRSYCLAFDAVVEFLRKVIFSLTVRVILQFQNYCLLQKRK